MDTTYSAQPIQSMLYATVMFASALMQQFWCVDDLSWSLHDVVDESLTVRALTRIDQAALSRAPYAIDESIDTYRSIEAFWQTHTRLCQTLRELAVLGLQ
jgi:hypothetical protein